MTRAESADVTLALECLDRLYGKLKTAKDTGEDYDLDVVAEALLTTMQFVGALAMREWTAKR